MGPACMTLPVQEWLRMPNGGCEGLPAQALYGQPVPGLYDSPYTGMVNDALMVS